MTYYLLDDDKAAKSAIGADVVSEVLIEERDVNGEVLRVQELIGASWSGVRNCGSDRMDNELRSAMRSWVGDRLQDHVNLKVVKWGHDAGSWSSSNSTSGWPDNRRSCRGSLRVPAYIVFLKPS
ncbi:hypothetical protein [Brevundimonas sp.]